MKIKIKEAYLLVLIVLGLVSLSVYSTYALFTKEVTIDNVVSFNATLSLSDSNLVEYELVTLNPNETKIIELRVSNSSTSTLYYGCWYETLSTNPDITIGMYLEKSNVPSTGTITTTETKTLVVGIVNNSTSTTLVNLGVVGSTTSSLGLSSSRIIITDFFSPAIIVTDEVLAANTTTTTTTETTTQEFTEAKSYEITLGKGSHILEVWGAQGGSYSTYLGGKGGYSKGTLTLTEDTTAFVYVGGQPATVSTNQTTVAGGFNGGGNGFNRYYSGTYTYGQGGGGASDIRIGTDSLYARVIVAGGGGGSASADGSAKYGGGTTGGSAQSGYGASQTSAGTNGSFGQGGSATTNGSNYKYGSGGGGGGWYGGGASSQYSDSTNYQSYNGGGSGYVYTSDTVSNCPSGCLLNSSYYLTNAATYGGNTSFTDFNGATVTGRTGNGAAKITSNMQVEKNVYKIPIVLGLTQLDIKVGTSIDLEEGITYECENGSTSCTYLGPEIDDTSFLELGTHIIYYVIKSSNNIVYKYARTINVMNEIPANSPDLIQGLIPVVYDSSTSAWVKADTTNANNSWYDYDQKKWANAVLVSKTNRETYQNAVTGTTISDSDILDFYVWIPRYKYKVWNINKTIGVDSYNAENIGIDIKFENEKETTGTISCTYNFNVDLMSSDGINLNTTTAETCTGSNGDYYTHPAFTFGSNELRGFWMGKFKLTSSGMVPNKTILTGNLSTLYTKIYEYQTITDLSNPTINTGNGLSTSRTNVDSHMIKNIEWGAVTYLTNSKYGRCTNGTCVSVSRNICADRITGIGGSDTVSSNVCTTAANMYNGSEGMLASTTGNVTGVYDMLTSNSMTEYVMGNASSSSRTYTVYESDSGFSSSWYTSDNDKYITSYAYGYLGSSSSQSDLNQTSYNRSRLGDATGEIVKEVVTNKSNKIWYGATGDFPTDTYSWFARGSALENSSMFIFYGTDGEQRTNSSTRGILVELS